MINIKAWVSAFRLRTLPLSLSGILFGSFYALFINSFDGLIFGLAIVTTLCLQILSNLANDLGDTQKGADNENRVGPTRAVQSGAISVSAMKKAVIVFSVLSLLFAIPLILIGTTELPVEILYTYLFLALACVVAAIMYTVGKKAYGYQGLGDLFVFIFFGLVSTLGIFTLLAHQFDLFLILPASAIGMLSAAVLNLNNLRDHENDAKVGKRSIVVKIGFEKAKVYHYSLIIGSFLLFFLFSLLIQEPFLLLNLIPFFILFKHLTVVKQTTIPKLLDVELKKVALSTFLICVISGLVFSFL
ncbi:MAG: 1,4-dihydroxy-2-naphthoate octaprenyltransferase [Lishizhenia sp.]